MQAISENEITSLATKFINNTTKNIFLTGKAGTGKTTFLKYIIKHTYKNAVIVAPTGIAAINAGGATIHSLFQMPFGAFVPTQETPQQYDESTKVNNKSTLLKGMFITNSKRRLLQELELLIIDEVSMLRADLLDAIDTLLRYRRRCEYLPFGGVQVLFIGDLLQLPPVVKDPEWQVLKSYYKTPYFFDSHVLQQHKPLYLELDKIYRQTDQHFISILNHLRNNQISEDDISILNSHYQANFDINQNHEYIYLTTHNHKAELINRESLKNIHGQSFVYQAEISGDFNESAYPIEASLELKKNAQVMFIKNDPTGEQRFFNGKIGTVLHLNEHEIEIGFKEEGPSILIKKYEWKNIRYVLNSVSNEIEENTTGTFSQYPIKLAWAITIHKSQGLTFDKAAIDVSQAFAPGQIYVALSRLRTLEGLILTSPINLESLHIDENILHYAQSKIDEKSLSSILKTEEPVFFKNYILRCFDFLELSNKLFWHQKSYQKDESKSAKQKHYAWAIELKQEVDSLRRISDKFIIQLTQIFEGKEEQYKQHLQSRIIAAKNHFEPILKRLSKHVFGHIERVKTESKVKAYLQELVEIESYIFKQIQLILKAESMVKSSIENSGFSKTSIGGHLDEQDRVKELAVVSGAIKKQTKKSEAKTDKINTKDVSYQLYLQHKSLAEIAKERGLTQTTIENHLAHYVALGLIDVHDFINIEKSEPIRAALQSSPMPVLTAIKNTLGDKYSYSDIRFVMASIHHQKNKSEVNQKISTLS